jgi:hypothetical protein
MALGSVKQGCVIAIRSVSTAFIVLANQSVNALATEREACLPIAKILQQRLPSLGSGRWNAITLSRDGQAQHIVFTQLPAKPTNLAAWVLASRESESRPDNYCIQAEGSEVNPSKVFMIGELMTGSAFREAASHDVEM